MPEITEHSALRYRQRINPSEPYPKQRLREAVESGEPVEKDDIDGRAVELDGGVAVLKDGTVTTVLRRCPA
jgi:hypothetical protein